MHCVVSAPRGNVLTVIGYGNVHTLALLYTTSVGLVVGTAIKPTLP